MRIGFDISQTGSTKAGCGYFADSLIRSLARIDSDNEYLLYPTFGTAFWDSNWSTTAHIDRPNFRRGLGHRSLEEMQHFWANPPADFESQLANLISYMPITSSAQRDCVQLEQFAHFTIWGLSRFQSLLQRPIGSCVSTECFAPVSTPIGLSPFLNIVGNTSWTSSLTTPPIKSPSFTQLADLRNVTT